jgi:hypothetical protein
MSAAELHTLQSRMRRGMLNKARWDELDLGARVGYVKAPAGGLAFDPDEQARGVVRRSFEQFDRLGTIRQVLRYLCDHGFRYQAKSWEHAGRPDASPTVDLGAADGSDRVSRPGRSPAPRSRMVEAAPPAGPARLSATGS